MKTYMEQQTSACILNYGKNLPRNDHGLNVLHYTKIDKTHDRLADVFWQTATYVSPHQWQVPDVVCDLGTQSVPGIKENSKDFIFSMPPSDSTLYLSPHFWNEISGWLAPDGLFVAVSADMLINGYLKRLNKYTTYYKLQQYDFSRLTPSEQEDVNQGFSLFRADIIAWSANALTTVNMDLCSQLLTDSTDLHRCLVFRKKVTSLLGMA